MIPLWCKSNFSFLEGASHPEELVAEAHRLGLGGIALTDRDGVYGIVRAFVAARDKGFPLITGSEMTLADGTTIVLLCQDREGYKNLCQLVTQGRLRSDKGESRVQVSEVCERSAGLIALWRGALAGESDPGLSAKKLKEAFADRLYALLARHCDADEVSGERRLRERAARFELPLVAAQEVLYHHVARRPLQDVLTCIRHGVTLAAAGRKTKPNTEHALKTEQAFAHLFSDVREAVARTDEVAARCAFSLSALHYRYPSENLPNGLTSSEWLCELTMRGANQRYNGSIPDDVRTQLAHELALINQLEYPGYFLTMWDIVEFCRSNSILCQGRGSAANSVVCYCLGITAIDPVRMGLLFERFISIERPEPPDIDLDIEHARREEVIQHVYAKYGRTHAAMVANVIRYRTKSALRDVGKVLGFSETALDRMAKVAARGFSENYGDNLAELPAEVLQAPNAMHAQLLLRAQEILDFPRHLSIHPGGFLLGHEPIADLVPIENATMPERTVIQWDKYDVEALGLFKVDLLGLGALTQLDACFQLLRKHHGRELSMATIPPEDEDTYALIQRGDTVGVFQIESRAQMAMLPRLKPRTFYDLVIEVSIVRPGPITGGMVHPYLRRRSGEEAVDYPHPSLEPVLKKTLGIPLFQEQVMKLAVVAADYTPGEADQLRRDMAAWRSSGKIEQHKDKLISRMQKKGIALAFAERVFAQIRGFGEYGFPESHAASFALICYASAWFRRHYIDVFTCALLNAQPMGFYSPATIVDDAKRHGLEVLPIDVMKSAWDCTLEGKAMRMGLRYVRGLGEKEGERIVHAAGSATLSELITRTNLDSGALNALAEADAFAGYGVDRRQAVWEARRPRVDQSLALPEAQTLPHFAEVTGFDAITWDYSATGHSTRGHILRELRPQLTAQKLPEARALASWDDGKRVRYAGIVICRQRPGTAAGVTFMTLEDETGFVNVVVWRQVFEKFDVLLKTTSFLGVSGRIQSEQGVVHLIADRFWQPRLALAPPRIQSRDFH
jgi:error-prone DNA polymerase